MNKSYFFGGKPKMQKIYLILFLVFFKINIIAQNLVDYNINLVETPFNISYGGGIFKSEQCVESELYGFSLEVIKSKSIIDSLIKIGLFKGYKNRHALIRNKWILSEKENIFCYYIISTIFQVNHHGFLVIVKNNKFTSCLRVNGNLPDYGCQISTCVEDSQNITVTKTTKDREIIKKYKIVNNETFVEKNQ